MLMMRAATTIKPNAEASTRRFLSRLRTPPILTRCAHHESTAF